MTWSYGRDLTLAPKQDAGPVNAMHKVYVEIDGTPHTAWDRKFTYRALRPIREMDRIAGPVRALGMLP